MLFVEAEDAYRICLEWMFSDRSRIARLFVCVGLCDFLIFFVASNTHAFLNQACPLAPALNRLDRLRGVGREALDESCLGLALKKKDHNKPGPSKGCPVWKPIGSVG